MFLPKKYKRLQVLRSSEIYRPERKCLLPLQITKHSVHHNCVRYKWPINCLIEFPWNILLQVTITNLVSFYHTHRHSFINCNKEDFKERKDTLPLSQHEMISCGDNRKLNRHQKWLVLSKYRDRPRDKISSPVTNLYECNLSRKPQETDVSYFFEPLRHM